MNQTILQQVDNLEAKVLELVAKYDEAIRCSQESIDMYRRARDRADKWQAMAAQLAETLKDASERLDDLGVYGRKENRKELLDKYDAMVKASK